MPPPPPPPAAGQERVLDEECVGRRPALPQPNRWLPEPQASSTLMCDYCAAQSQDLVSDLVILETIMGFCFTLHRLSPQLRTVITDKQVRWSGSSGRRQQIEGWMRQEARAVFSQAKTHKLYTFPSALHPFLPAFTG